MTLNFTISEFLKSDTATAKGIDNTPDDVAIYDNLLRLIVFVLQPIRDKIAKPMIISSGYRCPKLNSAVGGVSNSQHVTGKACDFTISGMTPAQIIEKIKTLNLDFDQCINEYDRWVHISYNKGNNRKQYLKIG